jgi:hypothetical protein
LIFNSGLLDMGTIITRLNLPIYSGRFQHWYSDGRWSV